MPLHTGVFHTQSTTFQAAELNSRSFASTLLRLFPNGSAPMLALSSMLGKSKAKAASHGYFSKTLTFANGKVNAQHLPGATTLTFTGSTTAGMLPGQLLYNVDSRELMRILTVPTSTTLTVTRGFGRVAAANIETTHTLIVIGSAYEEGSARPTARGINTVFVPTYTQIFRNAWALTDTARASYTELGIENIQETKRDCMLLHAADQEASIFFSQPKMDTSGATPVHATQGIVDAVFQYASANTTTAGGTTSYSQLITALEPAFVYSSDMGNPKERIAFCGSTAMKVFNDLARINSQVQVFQDETQYGMQFTSFKFYKGTINLIEHPLFNGMPGLNKTCVVVDMGGFKLAYMDGRDTLSEEYGGSGKNNAGGIDSQGGSLTTEFAVELLNPAGCAVITNLTAAAAG